MRPVQPGSGNNGACAPAEPGGGIPAGGGGARAEEEGATPRSPTVRTGAAGRRLRHRLIVPRPYARASRITPIPAATSSSVVGIVERIGRTESARARSAREALPVEQADPVAATPAPPTNGQARRYRRAHRGQAAGPARRRRGAPPAPRPRTSSRTSARRPPRRARSVDIEQPARLRRRSGPAESAAGRAARRLAAGSVGRFDPGGTHGRGARSTPTSATLAATPAAGTPVQGACSNARPPRACARPRQARPASARLLQPVEVGRSGGRRGRGSAACCSRAAAFAAGRGLLAVGDRFPPLRRQRLAPARRAARLRRDQGDTHDPDRRDASSRRITSQQPPRAAISSAGADAPGVGRHHGHGAEDGPHLPARIQQPEPVPLDPRPPGRRRPAAGRPASRDSRRGTPPRRAGAYGPAHRA